MLHKEHYLCSFGRLEEKASNIVFGILEEKTSNIVYVNKKLPSLVSNLVIPCHHSYNLHVLVRGDYLVKNTHLLAKSDYYSTFSFPI